MSLTEGDNTQRIGGNLVSGNYFEFLRVALGADAADVRGLVLKKSMSLALIGLAIGLALAAGRLAELQQHAIEGVAAVASETRLRMVVIRVGQELRQVDELEASGLELRQHPASRQRCGF